MGVDLMNLIRATLISFFVAVLTFMPTELMVAGADLQATADSSAVNVAGLSIASGTFIAYATTSPTGANPNGTPLTLSRTSDAQYFYVRNAGSTSLVQFSISITYSAGPGPVTIDRCDIGVSFNNLNTCATGTKTVVTITSGVITLTIPPNNWFQFELDPKKTVLPVISVSVSSSQLRPATVTNS